MKNKMLIVLVLILVLALCACGTSASPVEDFEYEMNDGEVVITGYIGADQEIIIPAEINDRPVTQIGDFAFEDYDMTKLELPRSIRVIGEYAFTDCNCLEEIVIPDGLERIEDNAFYECKALTYVELPDSLQYLGYCSFGYCESLVELELPDNFTGFAIEYKVKYAALESGAVYAEQEGDAIMNPVMGDYTTLIVKENSETETMLRGYGWFYDINYKTR